MGFHEANLYKGHLTTAFHEKMAKNAGFKDKMEANGTQNIIPYYCYVCKVNCCKKNNYEIHLKTKKHKNNENAHSIANKGVFQCESCNMIFANKRNLQFHLKSLNHLKKTNKIFIEESEEDNQCVHCGKEYTSRSGLWKHIHKCHKDEDNHDKVDDEHESADEDKEHESASEDNDDDDKRRKPQPNNVITPELMMMLLQQNKEMQQAVIEIVKKIGNTTTNSHNTTNNIQNNNKSFNLNVFLNETCKDAMNMSDFLNRLDVTTYDFEETGKNGYVQGMCRILENGLNQLEVHERPIHCTDAKRETIYIKDNDKWEKDDDKKTKLTSVIKQVGAKNIKMIPQWCKEHPGWNDGDSKENDRYLKYVFNSMCGGTDEEIYKNYGDIARYISKITVVDKNPQPLAII